MQLQWNLSGFHNESDKYTENIIVVIATACAKLSLETTPWKLKFLTQIFMCYVA